MTTTALPHTKNTPISIIVEPFVDRGSNTAATAGLVFIGNLPSVHEASLFLRDELSKSTHYDETTKNKKSLYDLSNPLLPQRISFEKWRSNIHQQSGTVFSPRPVSHRNDDDDDDDDDDNNSNNPNTFSILPVLPGEWLAAPLTTTTTTTTTTATVNNNICHRSHTCGAVFWHAATIGPDASHAARTIQKDICIDGRAGRYNLNVEPKTFEDDGGRLIGRYAWDYPRHFHKYNGALDEESEDKCDLDVYYDTVCCPDFLFAPGDTYLTKAWPAIRELGGCGTAVFDGDVDPERPRARLLHDATVDDDDDDDDDGSCSTTSPSYVRGLFESQEYLMGRILTSEIVDDGDDDQRRRVAHLLVVFTYDCPPDLDDAYVLNEPISGVCGDPLRLVMEGTNDSNRGKFIAFVLRASVKEIAESLKSVSSHKIMDVLEWEIVRNETTPMEDMVRAMDKMVPILFTHDDDDNDDVTTNQRGLLLSSLDFFLTIVAYLKPPLLEAFLLRMNPSDLSDMVQSSYDHYNKNEDPYNPDYPPRPTILLAKSPSLQCTEVLIRAGVKPDVPTVAGTMSRYDIFVNLATIFLDMSTSKMTTTTTTITEQRDTLLIALAFQAARELHADALRWILERLSPNGKQSLLGGGDNNDNDNDDGIKHPPPPHLVVITEEILGPVPLWDKKAPPASRGSLGRVIMGNFARKHSEYFEYKWVMERCHNQNSSGGSTKCQVVSNTVPADIYEMELTGTVDVVLRQMGDRHRHFERELFELPNDFWTELGYVKRYCGLGSKTLVAQLKLVVNALMDRLAS